MIFFIRNIGISYYCDIVIIHTFDNFEFELLNCDILNNNNCIAICLLLLLLPYSVQLLRRGYYGTFQNIMGSPSGRNPVHPAIAVGHYY